MTAVWHGVSVSAVFYYFPYLLFILYLTWKDRRYAWIIFGVAAGSFLLFFQRQTMERDIQIAEKRETELSSGEIRKLSKTKSGKRAVTLKNDHLEGEILLYDSGKTDLFVGDKIRFEGDLRVWEEASNPGQFSSRSYYFSKGIYYYSYSDQIEVLGHREIKFSRMLEQARCFCEMQIQRQYQGEVRNFVRGMVLGDKTGLSDEIKDDFRESGLIHLLAVSGLHISLVGQKMYRLMQKIGGGFLLSSVVGLLLAWFYCLLTGMSVSSMRAVVMFAVYCLAQVLGECYDMLSSAGLAGIFLLSLHPFYICDTGFILSFTAVAVIGCFQILKPVFRGGLKKILDSILFCAAIQLGMLPMILYLQYETPLCSGLANFAAVPMASVAFFAAVVVLWLPYTPLHWGIGQIFECVLWIAKQQYGMLTIGAVPEIWVFFFYGVFILLIMKNDKIRFGIRICLIYVGIYAVISIPILKKHTVTFLDVGQGDCMIARTNAGLIMYDGGSSSEDQVGRYRILPYMKYCGYSKVKVAVVSHLDLDHYSGIVELLKMGRIEYLGIPEAAKDKTALKLRRMAKKAKTQVFTLSKGQRMEGAGISLEVLHPQKGTVLEKNAASLVMQGKLLGFRVLLTGDVEKEGEEELLEQELQSVEILKVAHHGSKNSTSEIFLNRTKPEISVISCGKGNLYGHPHSETLKRLKESGSYIYRTDRDGALIFQEKERQSLK